MKVKQKKKPWSTNRRNMYLVLLCKLYGCIYFRFELFWNLIYYKCMQQELISSILSKLIWREKYSLETFEICSFKIFDTHWNALTFLLFSKAYTWNFRTLCYWNRWKSIPFWENFKTYRVCSTANDLCKMNTLLYMYLSPKYHLKQ